MPFDLEHYLAQEELMGVANLEALTLFSQRVERSREDLLELLQSLKDQNKKVISYGATSKSTTIFNYCGIDNSLVEYITDTTPEKQGLFSPGVHIPVIKAPLKIDESVDIAFLGAWNFEEEIKKKERSFVDRGGKFITHVPKVLLR